MDEEERRSIEEALARLKAEMDSMMSGMMAGLAPAISTAQFIEQEARAWDAFAAAYQHHNGGSDEDAAAYADKMLSQRRRRFTVEGVKARLEHALQSESLPMCGAVIPNSGGRVCEREALHDGEHQPGGRFSVERGDGG